MEQRYKLCGGRLDLVLVRFSELYASAKKHPKKVVLLAAFAVRAVFLLQWFRLPYIDAPCADAWANHVWALEILNGGFVRHTAFYQSPLYPYLLAGYYKVFGPDPRGFLWLQAAADACSCALIMSAAGRCFGRLAGLMAGLFAAFYAPFIFSQALLTKETFALFGAALFFVLCLRADERGTARSWFLCGLAAGGAVLLKTNYALLIPAALLWAGLRRGFGAGFAPRAAVPLLLGSALAALPATAHNFLAARDFVPVNYCGGFTFFIANNPEAAGIGNFPLGVTPAPLLEEEQPARLAEAAVGRPLKPSEISSFWFRRGAAFIAEHPLRWLELTAFKFWLFWSRYEISDDYDLSFVRERFSTVLRLPLVSFAHIGCLGAAGLFLCRPGALSGLPLLLFLSYLASVLPFWMNDRYRLPAVIFLIPLAAAVLDRLAGLIRKREWRKAAALPLPASPLILLCLLPAPFDRKFDEGAGWGQLTAVYAERGDYHKALAAFGRAAAASPESVNPAVIDKAAFSLKRLGRAEEALELYATGVELYPGSALLHNNRGVMLFEAGRIKEGVEAFERSVKADPAPGPQYKNLARGYARLGRKEKASFYGEKAAAGAQWGIKKTAGK